VRSYYFLSLFLENSCINVEFLHTLLVTASTSEPLSDDEEDSWNFPDTCENNKKKVLGKVDKYLEGLHWNMRMYVQAECFDYNYIFPVESAPNIQDFSTWMSINQISRYKSQVTVGSALEPFQSAILLVPGWGKQFLPRPVQKFVEGKG
jgi:5'-3' exonuclease